MGTDIEGRHIACVCDNAGMRCLTHQAHPYLVGVSPIKIFKKECTDGQNVKIICEGEVINSYNRLSNDGADFMANNLIRHLRRQDASRFAADVDANKPPVQTEGNE